MRYLMIENDANAIPSVDMLTTIGLSGSRGNDRIGQFGSGFKYSLALLARLPYVDSDGNYHSNMLEDVRVCLGLSVCTYELRDQTARHASGTEIEYKRLFMKGRDAEHTGTNKTYDLNMSAEFGAIDWSDIKMALREFVSNAFDGQDDYNDMNSGNNPPVFEIIETDKRGPRAKKGKIRLYIPVNDDVMLFYNNLKIFYARMNDGYNPERKIIDKAMFSRGLFVYKKGVLVYSNANTDTAYSYNVDVYLDESRNATLDSVKSAISETLADVGTAQQIANVVSNDCFERKYLNRYDFTYHRNNDERLRAYNDAFKLAFGNKVICSNSFECDLVARRGMDAIVVDNNVWESFGALLDNSSLKILSADERDGRILSEPTEDMRAAYDRVWNAVVRHGLHYGKEKPSLVAFDEGTNGGSRTMGIYKDGKVYLHNDLGGVELVTTIVEELCHHCAQCGDLSRDFQNWCCKLIAKMIM